MNPARFFSNLAHHAYFRFSTALEFGYKSTGIIPFYGKLPCSIANLISLQSKRSYLNFKERHPPIDYSSCRSPQIFLAELFRDHGLHSKATALFRKAAERSHQRYEARCGHADLLLVRARWATEFASYLGEGQTFNPWSHASSPNEDWREANASEAKDLLIQAIADRPDDERAPWLLALAYEIEGNFTKALEHVDYIESLRHGHYESDLGHLRMRIEFQINPKSAVAIANSQLNGWKDSRGHEWYGLVAKHADLRSFSTRQEPIVERRDLNIRSGFAVLGKYYDYASSLSFEPAYSPVLDEACILPHYGTVIANGKYLLRETCHMRDVHLTTFTPNVRSVSERNSLLCLPRVEQSSLGPTIYIGSNDNYFHWLLEDLPRLSLLGSEFLASKRRVIVSTKVKTWQIDLLKRFGVGEDNVVRADLEHPLLVKNVVVPSRLSRDGIVDPEATKYVRKVLLKNQECAPKPGKRIYLSRKSTPGRSMINSAEVEQFFSSAGFIMVDPAKMTIDQQIDTFSDVEVIAGPAGAGFTNAVFAPREARLIQLASSDVCGETFTSLASAIGQKSCWCLGVGAPRTYHRWIWTNFDFEINIKDAKLCLDQMI